MFNFKLRTRWKVYNDGKRAQMPYLDEESLKELEALIHKRTGITFLPSYECSSLLVTGEIPRETSYEKGFPFQYAENRIGNETTLVTDPLVRDDQAIVVNVKNKGLVILTGCGHSGIINTINYAKKVTEMNKVHAVVGGFHLREDGGIYEELIEPTLDELQQILRTTGPCHCTGWKVDKQNHRDIARKILTKQTSMNSSLKKLSIRKQLNFIPRR